MTITLPSFFRADVRLVILVWVFFQVAWYLYVGVHFDFESLKYIAEADHLLQYHQFSQSRYLFYSATIAVILFSKSVGLGLYGALFLIMAFNLWSYVFFYKALRKFFGGKPYAFCVVGLLMAFWPYQSWSWFLFTECLFYSLTMVLLSHLLLLQRLSNRFLLTIGGILVLLILTRPLGILFVPATMAFLFFKLTVRQRWAFAGAVLLFAVLLNFIVQVVFTTTSDWNMTRALTEDSIICDMPRASSAAVLDLSNDSNQIYQLFYYVTHNFGHFAGLALIRLRYFFTMVRPYFSLGHNLYLILFLGFLYASILFGVRKVFKIYSASLIAFLFVSVILFAATVALQCDDYHNRFALTLMPVYALLAIVVWMPLIRKLSFSIRGKG